MPKMVSPDYPRTPSRCCAVDSVAVFGCTGRRHVGYACRSRRVQQTQFNRVCLGVGVDFNVVVTVSTVYTQRKMVVLTTDDLSSLHTNGECRDGEGATVVCRGDGELFPLQFVSSNR